MSSYYSSFNYLGINSRSKNLVVAHFDADSGESETFLNIEPIYTDSASGVRRLDYGAKYGSVAIFRINVIKPDGNEFSVTEIRDCLKWLTGSISNSTLDLLIGDQIKYSFIGRITNVWQYKMDAKTVGLILEFTSSSPFAYSPKQHVSCSVSGTKTLQIHCPSDDLNSYVYMQTTYENTSGTSLTIENITTEDKTEVKELVTNEIITIDNNIMITSDKQGKTFGNTFNFCFPRLTSGINNLIITANGNITFEYSYPIKIGDLAIDTDELNGAIDCESGAGTGTVATEYVLWENILNKPPTISESSENFYTKTEVDTAFATKSELNSKADKSTTLAGYGITDGENIGNKVTDKSKITDEDANYPSIGYLYEYYYDYSEVDKALSGKLDNVAGSVTTDNIASKAVTSDKIANGAITALKLANGAVSGSNIAQNQISANHLQNGAVTTDKLADEVKESINGKADKATTLDGYGITDAYTKSESKKRFGLDISVTFDENFIPLSSSSSKKLSTGMLTNIENNIKYMFISSKVTYVSSGIFSFPSCSNIEAIFVDNSKENILINTSDNELIEKIHYVDDFNANNYIIQALMATNSAKLPLCELKENKIHDIQSIQDSDVQYPSITYLNEYHYQKEETDSLLNTKLDSSSGSVTSLNLASGAVTLSKLSDDVRALISSGGSGGEESDNFTKTLTGKYIISIVDGAANGTTLSVTPYVDSTESIAEKYYFSHYNGSTNVYDEMKEENGAYTILTNANLLENNMKFKITNSNTEGSVDNSSTCVNKNNPTITVSDGTAALGIKAEIEPEYNDIAISGTNKTTFKITFIPSANNAVTGEIIVNLVEIQFNSVGLIGTINGSGDWSNESYELKYSDGVWSTVITFTGGANDFKARVNDGWDISFGGSSNTTSIIVISEQDLNNMLSEVLV